MRNCLQSYILIYFRYLKILRIKKILKYFFKRKDPKVWKVYVNTIFTITGYGNLSPPNNAVGGNIRRICVTNHRTRSFFASWLMCSTIYTGPAGCWRWKWYRFAMQLSGRNGSMEEGWDEIEREKGLTSTATTTSKSGAYAGFGADHTSCPISPWSWSCVKQDWENGYSITTTSLARAAYLPS
jgi:hypothetical protein